MFKPIFVRSSFETLAVLLLAGTLCGHALSLSPAIAGEVSPPAGEKDLLVLDGAVALSTVSMQGDRAGQADNTVMSTQALAATTSGNVLSVAGNLTNGNISMGDSFGGGFGSYVMNTGNNSTLTAATAVTIQMGPAP